MSRGPGKERPVRSFGLALSRLLSTVFGLRCPSCGVGRVARGPFNLLDACGACGACGAKLRRADAGHWLVSATINYFLTALLCIFSSVLLVRAYGFFSGLTFVVAGLALLYGALLYRPAKTLAVWLLWVFGFIYPDERVHSPNKEEAS